MREFAAHDVGEVDVEVVPIAVVDSGFRIT
jgi:hypothetical protein